MACKITPRSVVENVRERLETAFPGITAILESDGSYSVDIANYKSSTIANPQKAFKELSARINKEFGEDVIKNDSIKATAALAKALTVQNENDALDGYVEKESYMDVLSPEERVMVFSDLFSGAQIQSITSILQKISDSLHPLGLLARDLTSRVGNTVLRFSPEMLEGNRTPQGVAIHESVKEALKSKTIEGNLLGIYDIFSGRYQDINSFIEALFSDVNLMEELHNLKTPDGSLLEASIVAAYEELGVTDDTLKTQALAIAFSKAGLSDYDKMDEALLNGQPTSKPITKSSTFGLSKGTSRKAKEAEGFKERNTELTNSTISTYNGPYPPPQDKPKALKDWYPKKLFLNSKRKGGISNSKYLDVLNTINNLRTANQVIQLKTWTDKDGVERSAYYDYGNKTWLTRVSNLVYDEDFETNEYLVAAQKHGNRFDAFVRAFLDGELTPEMQQNDYLGDPYFYDYFVSAMQGFKETLESRGEEVIPGEIVLHSSKLNLAGTVDIMTVDENGGIHIYDLKTMRGVGTNFEINSHGYTKYDDDSVWEEQQQADGTFKKSVSKKVKKESKRIKHQKQLTLYSYLLQDQHNVIADSLGILPVEIDYEPGEDTKVTDAEMKEVIEMERLSSIRGILAPRDKKEKVTIKAPLDASTMEYINFLRQSNYQLKQAIEELNKQIRNEKNPDRKKDLEQQNYQLRSLERTMGIRFHNLRKEGARELLDTIEQDMADLKRLIHVGVTDASIDSRVYFLNLFINNTKHELDSRGVSTKLDNNLTPLSNYDVPEYLYLQGSLKELNKLYDERKIQEAYDIIDTDILVHNMVANNKDLILAHKGITPEQFEAMTPDDQEEFLREGGEDLTRKAVHELSTDKPSWYSISEYFLSLGYSMEKDSIIPQVMKSVYQTYIEKTTAKYKNHTDRLKELQLALKEKQKQGGYDNLDFMFQKLEGSGQMTNKLQSVINDEMFHKVFTRPLESIHNDFRVTKATRGKKALAHIRKKADIIDVRKLPGVYDKYSGIYPQYFDGITEDSSTEYLEELKEKLGPAYKRYVDSAIKSMDEGMAYLAVAPKSDDRYDTNLALMENNPLYAASLVTSGRTTGDSVLKDGKAQGYPNYMYSTFLPKDTKLYNTDFIDEISNDPLKADLWGTYKDIYSDIGFSYRMHGIDSESVAREEKGLGEKIGLKLFQEKANLITNSMSQEAPDKSNLIKTMSAVVATANEIKRASFGGTKGNYSAEKQIQLNYGNTYENAQKKLADTLMLSTVASLEHIAGQSGIDTTKIPGYGATNKAMKQRYKENLVANISHNMTQLIYSPDIFKSTYNAIDSAVRHEAREVTIPKAKALLNLYKGLKVSPDKFNGKEMTAAEFNKASINKMEYFIDTQLYGYNQIVLDLDGNPKDKNSVLKKDLKRNWIVAFRDLKSQDEAGQNLGWKKKTLLEAGKLALDSGFISPKIKAFIDDRETVLFTYLDALLSDGVDKGMDVSIRMSDNSTVSRKWIATPDGTDAKKGHWENTQSFPDGIVNIIDESEFDEKFQEHIMDKMDTLGLSTTLDGLLNMALNTARLAALGWSISSSYKNRVEGKFMNYIGSQMLMYYSNPKHNNLSNNFLFGYNTWKLSSAALPGQANQFEILTYLADNTNMLQSTVNTDDQYKKGITASSTALGTITDAFAIPVSLPEGKIQMTALLNILQDTYLEDENGEKHQVFDGQRFPAWDFVDGRIKLKPQFRVKKNSDGTVEENFSNVQNWENFVPNEKDLSDNNFVLARRKVIELVEATQGDYSEFNNIMINKSTAGRYLTAMFKWAFMQARLYWKQGGGINITRGVEEEDGIMRGLLKNNPLGFTAAASGSLLLTAGLTPFTGLVGGGVLALAMYNGFRHSKKKASKDNLTFSRNWKGAVGILYETALSTANLGLHMLYSKHDLRDIKSLNNVSEYLGDGDRNNQGRMQGVGATLAVMNWSVILPLVIGGLFGAYDDDDDDDDFMRMFYNWVANDGDRYMSTPAMLTNPFLMLKQVSELYGLGIVEDTYDGVTSSEFSFWRLASMGAGNFVPRPAKTAYNMLMPNKTGNYNPLGSLFKGIGLDPKEYNSSSWHDVLVRDIATDGEYSAKKEYLKKRKEIKGDIRVAERLGITDFFTPHASDAAIDAAIKAIPKKKKKETYKEAKERLDNLYE